MGSFVSSMLSGGSSTPAPAPGPSCFTAIHSSESWHFRFNSLKQSNKLVVVDFSAIWCESYNFMEPVFNRLLMRYSNIELIRIYVDQLPDVAKEFGVEGMLPAFVLLKQGKEVGRVVGADHDEIEKQIEQAHGN